MADAVAECRIPARLTPAQASPQQAARKLQTRGSAIGCAVRLVAAKCRERCNARVIRLPAPGGLHDRPGQFLDE
jgi:hypothetical protein